MHVLFGVRATAFGYRQGIAVSIVPFEELDIGEIWLFGGFCGRDSGIGPAQRAKTTIWN